MSLLKTYVDSYKLDRISSRMAKDFGKIPRGGEEMYSFIMHPMEGNMLKLHRAEPSRNGRHAIDAIHMCLLTIDGYINGIEYDFSRIPTEHCNAFYEGLLFSFDPFNNQELLAVAKKVYDLNAPADLKKIFELPVKCLLRIEKSIELWTNEFGANGYFKFIEDQLGHIVDHDNKMNYTMAMEGKDSFDKLGIDVSELDQKMLSDD